MAGPTDPFGFAPTSVYNPGTDTGPSWAPRGTSTGTYSSPTFNYGQYSAPAQNLQNIPYIEDLTRSINAINLAGQQQANVARIPGEAGLEAKSSANIAQELAGNVPQDVIDLLQQRGAERGVTSGQTGGASFLRALGLTSLGQEQVGQQNLTAATARNPAAPLYNPTQQLLTPDQLLQAELEQQRLNLQAAQGGRGGARDIIQAAGGGSDMLPSNDTGMYVGGPSLFTDFMGSTPAAPPTYISEEDWFDPSYGLI